MAYSGTTNPPVQVSTGGLTGVNANAPVPKIWSYQSPDPIATVQGAAYFADGIQRGMSVNDIVYVTDTNLQRLYLCFVAAVTPIASTNAFKGAGIGSATLNSTTTPMAD